MRTAVLLSVCLLCTSLRGQLALSPSQPAIQGTSTVFVFDSPAITPPSLSTQTAVTTVSNLTLEDVSSLLTNLQSILEQTLPVLAAFNDGFDFVAVQGSGTTVQASGTTQVTPLPSATISNLLARLSNRMAIGAPLPTTGPETATNTFGVPPGFSSFPITRDTVRELMILQNEIVQILPALNALNSGNNTSPQGE
jgi:hypothetical protein